MRRFFAINGMNLLVIKKLLKKHLICARAMTYSQRYKD
ncbi:hypothetical protein SynSYN20_01967 [Synechococcus sp. SYN20]|nr:hypothetical protein SynSYN20_01967 [Synechococcus sp. SYN20]